MSKHLIKNPKALNEKPSKKKGVFWSLFKKNQKREAAAPPPPQPLLTKEGKGVVNGRSGGVFRRGRRGGVFNFKRWHKISAAFASIAIIGVIVFFQFAPEKAMRGIFESFAV